MRPTCDLGRDSDTDLNDLVILAGSEWLWQPCWFTDDTWMMPPATWPLGPNVSAQITAFALQEAKEARWLQITPPHEMTLIEEIAYYESILDWLEQIEAAPGISWTRSILKTGTPLRTL